jgi:membrane-associated phospholipid phosphatase
MNIDHKLSHGWYSLVSKHWLSRALAVFGASYLIWLMIGAAVGVYVYRLGIGEHLVWFETLLGQILVTFPAFGFAFLITRLVGRKRPYQEKGQDALIDPYVKTSSFPSLHTTIAFAGATVAWGTPLGPFILVCAFFVALSRVAVGVHFFSDIIVGAILGTFVTFATLVTVGVTWLFYLGVPSSRNAKICCEIYCASCEALLAGTNEGFSMDSLTEPNSFSNCCVFCSIDALAIAKISGVER